MHVGGILSLIVIACAVGIGIAGKRLRRDDTSMYVAIMVLTLVPAAWIPRFWRDLILSGGIGLILWFVGDSFGDKLGWSLGVAGPLYALSWVVPGGASVILIFFTLIGLWYTGRSSWKHLRRLRNAAALDPNARSEAEVEIGGTVRLARASPSLPNVDLDRAGGWRLFGKPEKFFQPEHVELTTSAGPVLIALDSIDLENVRLESPSEKYADEWRARFGLEKDDLRPMLEVVDADKEAYVIGTPTWMRAPETGGYRDSPMVPVFGKGATLYQLPEAEVDARTWWNLVLAIGFAIATGSVGVTQALGSWL